MPPMRPDVFPIHFLWLEAVMRDDHGHGSKKDIPSVLDALMEKLPEAAAAKETVRRFVQDEPALGPELRALVLNHPAFP